MKNMAIAKRYARALLLIGKEDGQTENYRREMASIAELMAANKSLADTISNPLYAAAQRRQVLEASLGKLNLSKAVSSFLMLLFEKGRFGFLANINDFFQQMADELKGVARASLVSATDLDDAAIEKIRSALSKRTGKDVILEVTKDPSLIGGIVTRIGDLVLDGSIKQQLLNMRETLKRGESA